MKYCNNCGKSMEDSDVFCNSCGAEFGTIIEHVPHDQTRGTRDELYEELELAALNERAGNYIDPMKMHVAKKKKAPITTASIIISGVLFALTVFICLAGYKWQRGLSEIEADYQNEGMSKALANTPAPKSSEAPTPTPVAELTGEVVNVKTSVNVRSAPDKTSDLLWQADKGQRFSVNAGFESDEWYEISYEGTTGYIHKDYMKLVVDETEREADSKETYMPILLPKPYITLNDYNLIEKGDSYGLVVSLAGSEGEFMTEESFGEGDEYLAKMYSWKGKEPYSAAVVVFIGDKVSTKSQAGLK